MKKIIILLFLVFACAGCLLTPFVDAYNKSGFSPESRKKLLQEKIELFYNEVVAGRFLEFSEYLLDQKQDQLMSILRENRKNEKVIEGKPDFLDFNKDVKIAKVDVVVKYYQIPYYVVQERTERQTWVFVNNNQGWKLKSIEIGE